MSPRLVLPAFLLASVGGGGLVGLTVDTGGWYAALAKPAFNPPDWVFPPVWTALYILIGLAGYRVWRAGLGRAQAFWWVQLVLNFVWPPLFFTAQALLSAFAVILALLAAIAAFIATAWRREAVSAALFVPYGAWVAYAGCLNVAIWWLN